MPDDRFFNTDEAFHVFVGFMIRLLDLSHTALSSMRSGADLSERRTEIVPVCVSKSSEYNPDAIPERTIKKSHVMEFGPGTFPADADATAGVRSLIDWYHGASRTWTPAARRRVLLRS